MKFFKKALKALLCSSLILSLGLSAAACSTDDKDKPDGDNEDTGYVGTPIFTPPNDGSEGIDWSKYWDGVSNVGTSLDNFTFNKNVDIGSVTVTPGESGSTSSTAEQFIVTFNGNGGDGAPSQTVDNGGMAIKPVTPERNGYLFTGWNTSANVAYDFGSPVTGDITLYAQWKQIDSKVKSVSGGNESIAVIWEETSASTATVEYALSGTSTYTKVDAPLVRAVNSSTARVDIVGLKAGEYDVKITSSTTSTPITISPVDVVEYDRSGYAHFGYTNGIGAYTDDGNIKDGTLVIYLTEENKNDVLDSVYLNGEKEDISQYMRQADGTQVKGIGELLNNRRYSGNDRRDVGIAKLCDVYGSVAVRVIGTVNAENANDCKVSLITGLTDYDATTNGGSEGDNGRMARIVNAKNLTIEGIGEDACIYGWGVHFIASEINYKTGVGESFEVRNLTFEHYPEDAVGMEGEQDTKKTTAKLTYPVERCWVHNNVFLPGYCPSPTDSDKKEGDGSCDFKRGQYFTCSYNYFTDCHKTNLVGAASYTQTYNVTFHHNWWNNCGSRQFMGRQANIHYYNNYITQDMSNKPSGVTFNHIVDMRAGGYVFLEANYFDGCKNPTLTTGEGGGAAKALGNIYYACSGTNGATQVTNRTDTVSNNCKYEAGNIDYSTFDTSSTLFYYDAANEQSDCLLDDAVTARSRVMQFAGRLGFGQSNTNMNVSTPAASVVVKQGGTTVPLPTSTSATTSENVLFTGLTSASSGTVKFKGQGVTFTLAAEAEVRISTTSTGDNAPELLDSYGRLWAHRFEGTLTIVLPKGTYVIASGLKDKESTVTEITFADTAASSEARVASAQAALAAIPSTVTLNSEALIKEAQLAYSALLSTEREQIDADVYTRYLKAVKAFEELQVDYVIARINYIGTVTANSYNLINAAQTAYSSLTAEQQAKVTNYSTLTAALTTYSGFAAQNVINRILDLPDVSQANIKSQETLDKLYDWFNAVQDAFDSLDSDDELHNSQQAEVKNHNDGKTYQYLLDGFEELKSVENFLTFKELLTEASVENASTEGAKIISLYNGLTENQKSQLTGAGLEKFNEIKAAYEEFASRAVKAVYVKGSGFLNADNEETIFTVSGSGNKDLSKNPLIADGLTAVNGLELNSSTSITFTVEAGVEKTLVIYGTSAKNVSIDGVKTTEVGVAVTDEGYSNCYKLTIKITGTGNPITIKKGDGNLVVGVIELY